jgi:hypothetical protein
MIIVRYLDNHISKFASWEDIIDHNNIVKIDCSHMNLTQLPDMQRYHWPNLEVLDCNGNQLTQLPAIMA